jgi:hypothetical protein
MIKANELRIGNKVFLDEDGVRTIATIQSIGKDAEGYSGYYVSFSNGSCTIEDHFDDGELLVQAIPLTPEILEKAGFKYAADDDVWEECKLSAFEEVWWISGMYFIEKGWQGYTFYKSTDEDTYMQLVVIEHLHQLQNLYYALTNTELNIEL